MTAAYDTNRHAFKNQLAIIRGFAERLLAEAARGGSQRRELEEIHRAAEKALQLLDRLDPSGEDLAPS